MNATEYMAHWRGREVWKNLLKPKHQTRLRRCAELCLGPRDPGSRIPAFIDVGCALGHSTLYMSRFRWGVWDGLDFDAGAIDDARKLFPNRIFFLSPDYDLLRATEGKTFDSVVCSEVLEHVADEAGFIKGLAALARRRIVLTTPNVKVNDPGHLRLYTREALARLFAGYRTRILSEGRFFYIVVDRPSSGGAK